MIAHPKNWATVGQPISIDRLESTLYQILIDIDCNCLAFSGGVDSCLLLHFLLEQGRKMRTFTATCNGKHPDLRYAKAAIATFEKNFGTKIDSQFRVISGTEDNELVTAFYKELDADRIIVGDGVDEFMAGYYSHQNDPTEETYYEHLRRLQEFQLGPLNTNSGNVKVYVPYIDPRFIYLMSQIPLSEKVGPDGRKLIMMAMAEGKVPQDNIERRKYGFGTPFHEVVT